MPVKRKVGRPIKIKVNHYAAAVEKKEKKRRKSVDKDNTDNAKSQKTRETKKPVRATSKYCGVTHHCRTGRWEAHIWEDGKQMYLGGFDGEEQAALAYDIATVKCRGENALTNFAGENYVRELEQFKHIDKTELVLSLRRQSKGGTPKQLTSKYRGVTRHQKGKWEARIGLPNLSTFYNLKLTSFGKSAHW